tara:strand:- start:21 stop:197 length:177 start_codon:yes stop_codon:yes gene_type:complete
MKYNKIDEYETYPVINKNTKVDNITKKRIPSFPPPLNIFDLYIEIKTINIKRVMISRI